MIDPSIPSPFGPNEPVAPRDGKVSIAIEVDDQDRITITQCINPQFDLNLLTEALGMAVYMCAKYSERHTDAVLQEAIKNLRKSAAFSEKVRFIN